MARWSLRILSILALIGGAWSSSAQVVINEIMYHPASENVLEEYIELHNRGTTNVNVSGWRFSNGVDFTFPANMIMPPNSYLVVAAHRPTFVSKYSGVANVIGNWVGVLSNSRNDIDLDDASGNRIDSPWVMQAAASDQSRRRSLRSRRLAPSSMSKAAKWTWFCCGVDTPA